MHETLENVNDTLKYPSDLEDKLPSILSAYEKHVNEQEEYLKTKIRNSRDRINNSINLQQKIKSDIEIYKSNFKKLDQIYQSFPKVVNNYENIKIIAIAHQNFHKSYEMHKKLVNISNATENILKMIKNEENIENIHEEVFELEKFKYEIHFFSKNITRDEFLKLNEIINEIDRVLLEFENMFLLKTNNLINQLEINKEYLNQISKIVKKEEERDEITIKVQKGKHSHDAILHEIYLLNKIYFDREIKDIKNKTIKAIKYSINDKFPKLQNKDFNIQELNFIIEDMKFISETVNDKDLFIDLRFIYEEYHLQLKNFLDLNKNNLDASQILFLLEFINNYNENIEKNLNMQPETLGESLLGDSESELINKYLQIASEKLVSWISNITVIEVEKFNLRTSQPTVDENDKYISTGFINLLQIIKQQMEPITFNKHIFLQITSIVVENCHYFKNEIIKAMKKDFKPSVTLKSVPGYEEYVIMIGNSGLKLTQYINSLPLCQKPEVRELGNIFLEILKSSNTLLSEFIITTCGPILDKVFTDSWYEQDITKKLIITLEDFLGDYKITMADYSFITFVFEICNSLVFCYVKQITRKRAKILEDCSDKLKSDEKRLIQTFCKFADPQEVKNSFMPFDKIIPLLTTKNDDLFVVELKSLILVYPDIKKEFIKSIIKKRTDLNDSDKKNLIERLKESFGEEPKHNKKTLFSRLTGF
ncbi:subunit Sec6 of exocyst complex [Hamiltosporidium tvaerminnensis]|uniref:Subunit Sec6 of exocyst complex n=1 Tax=Hamiltosporidium tvaerminnensis TaxID=1176355 RepID=A0A4Q9LZB7_9MICR|nr:subunit Sec6 of exocyst complex [Hamiltosporidium tvaerminnensis]